MRLHHLSDTFWHASSCYPTDGMDEFSPYLPRRRHFYPSTRNTQYHYTIHRQRTHQRPRHLIYTDRWIVRNHPRQPQYSTIRVGTLSEPQSSRPAHEVLRRNVLRSKATRMRLQVHYSRPLLYLRRTASQRSASNRHQEMGTLQNTLRSPCFFRNHRSL